MALLAFLLLTNVVVTPAIPAPKVFVSGQYALTLRSPVKATICPLPKGWTGSDHGTILFLSPPQKCGGAGFPSSFRGWMGGAPSRRIEIYYQYWMGDDQPSSPPCHRYARVNFMGRPRSLCQVAAKGRIELSVSARYMADIEAWTDIRLITTPAKLSADLPRFKSLLESVRSCRSTWSDDHGKSGAYGRGAPCPAKGEFF